MEPLSTHQRGELGRIRSFDDASFSDDGIDQVSRGDIEDRIKGLDICREPLTVDLQLVQESYKTLIRVL